MVFAQLSKLRGGDKMNLIWYLLCYSLLGFVGEVLYARLTHSAKPDRKCRLFLPLCPVYGIGAVALTLALYRLRSRRELLIFFVAALAGDLRVNLLGCEEGPPASREALLAKLASCALLFALGRRLQFSRWGAAGSVLLFGLCPLELMYSRWTFLDNLVTPWLLLSFLLPSSEKSSEKEAA